MAQRPSGAGAGRVFSLSFFAGDRQARLALPLLSVRPSSEELGLMDPADVGPRVAELGERLYREGTLPGLGTWHFEECPEFADGIRIWREALLEESAVVFAKKVKKAESLALEGLIQIGNLSPKLGLCRWACCLTWIAARAALVATSSVGGYFQAPPAPEREKTSRAAKQAVFRLLNELLKDLRILAMFDYDLVGYGVWVDGGRAPLPEDAKNEWYRRGVELDVIMACHQACLLPPEGVNEHRPELRFLQVPGTPDWLLAPEDTPRLILERHEWACAVQPIPMDRSDKLLLGGTLVLWTGLPPPPVPDLDDPEVIAQIQRGEELSKQHQADGLPGALHGSIGFLFAGLCAAEKIVHVSVSAGMAGLQGFLDCLLRYSSPLQSLALAGCFDLVGPEMLQVVLPMAGEKLQLLDLERCGLDGDSVQGLLDCLRQLPGLRRLDLAGNELDGEAALCFVEALCENRIDLVALRFDENPVGDRDDFRASLAGILARRGAQVVAGGTISFLLGDSEAVNWSPHLKPDPPNATPLTVLRKVTEDQDKRLASMEENCEAVFEEFRKTGKSFSVAKDKYDNLLATKNEKNQGLKDYLDVEYDKAGQQVPESHTRRGAGAVSRDGPSAAEMVLDEL